MSRPRRARVPVTATLLTLGLAAATLVGVPAAQAAPAVQAAPVAAPEAAADEPFSVLVFSKTAGFRHDSIPTGIAAIQQLGAANGFTVDTTEDGAAFTDENLARYRVVVWLSTTGDVLAPDQQAAFERYIRAGGGYAGIHAASDTEYSWAWYGDLVGAHFASHPANQQATVKVEDHAHPSTAELPERWSRFDEWYNYQSNPRGDVHVLATLDETSYSPGAGAMGHDHPIAWCQDFDGGRAWYTGGGHTRESYAEPQFLAHLLGGIRTAAGVQDADCGASLTESFEKVALDSNTSNPMELDVAPDGRVFYIERDGRVQIVKPDTGSTVTALDLDVFTGKAPEMRIRKAVAAVLTGLVLAFLAAAPATAHSGKLKLTVAGDGAGGVTIQAAYADGHRLDKLVRLTLTAAGSGGRTVGPLQLEPAAEGQGSYTTGPILSPGTWTVRVTAPAPHSGAATAKVRARAPQTPSLAPVARDVSPARADRSTGDGAAPGWWRPVAVGVAVLLVVALTAPVLGRLRRGRS
ncbi:ThuA domain-containing protein [Micromonospora thermarum]|uniref:ThuA domain-containing protein n=1 Tax=Micromonospora thermarum TaxID=2720024 RepID=A0ABX0ZB86_9ACTN|nr:ThuA domain-containing protein [Micromonospora thermarum]NJP33155.1 ThuA domain-containing protein [Micromonospora thermarum]